MFDYLLFSVACNEVVFPHFFQPWFLFFTKVIRKPDINFSKKIRWNTLSVELSAPGGLA